MKQSTILENRFESRFASSCELSHRVRRVLAGGAAHDSWSLDPFPVAFARAEGVRKWDLDDQPIIDYWMGHGALLCGHSYLPVIEAVQRQLTSGLHFGGLHEMQVRWAEKIRQLIPAAKLTRFTSSGTEAVMLALRIARAFTGRNTIVKFDGHFHGWHDESLAHFVSIKSAGLLPGIDASVGLASEFDLASVEEWLREGDVAAVIVEPGGGGSGGLPCDFDFLRCLRSLTTDHGTLLIFDEVISGFRYAPGGVQSLCDVDPDLTVLGKIVCGGLPGGAVTGKANVMEVLGPGTEVAGHKVRVPHTGTFNANPLSAAAGVAMLEGIEDGSAQCAANNITESIVTRVNRLADELAIDAALFRQSSIFHILLGPRQAGQSLVASPGVMHLYHSRSDRYLVMRRALLSAGVDCHPVHGWVSTEHNEVAIESTLQAFHQAFKVLLEYDPELERSS